MIIACGLNHKTAPLNLRERVYFDQARLVSSLGELVQLDAVNEAAILSTCNRTELYCVSDNAEVPLCEWLAESHHLPSSELQPHLYAHYEQQAVSHLVRVASGLDSLVLGEPQILGQLKQAYHSAVAAGTVGNQLQSLFPFVFATTKKVRTDTNIGANAVSVANVAVRLASHIFSDLSEAKVFLLGAGDTIEIVQSQLIKQGVRKFLLASRRRESAARLAERCEQGEIVDLQRIPARISDADIIVSATSSPIPVLGKGAVEAALKHRRHKPMLLIDLAVPRDIEAEVAELDDAYLYNVDDLQEISSSNLNQRQTAALAAADIIEQEVVSFMQHHQAKPALEVIKHFRAQIENVRNEELQKALQQLARGVEPEVVMQRLAHNLTNKFMHPPCAAMRDAGLSGAAEMLTMAKQLFAIDDSDETVS